MDFSISEQLMWHQIVHWLSFRSLSVTYWWRWGSLVPLALFCWIAVLGWRDGSWTFVIRPLFSLAGLLFVLEWVRRKEPKYGGTLGAWLVGLVFLYNLLFAFQQHLPSTARAAMASVGLLDYEVSRRIAPPLSGLRRDIIKYDEARIEVERININRQLAELITKRGSSIFSDADAQRERELFAKQRELGQESADLQRMAHELLTPA